MKAKVIKSEAEYEAALAHIESLMKAEPGSPDEEELELYALLVERYEAEHYPIGLPDPIEAIKFRMEQEGLVRKDLVRYLGSPSKVSEVMNYRRPLSLAMIRSLHEGLGIPYEVLLQESVGEPDERHALEPHAYPFAEMMKLGYFEGFEGSLAEAKRRASDLLAGLFLVFQDVQPAQVYCRGGDLEINQNALKAWQARAVQLALKEELPPFSRPAMTTDFIREVVRLSYFSQGPELAAELLRKKGIHFVILPHLPKTYLDGACFYAPDSRPVVALTLRHDRLDNFWFTLVHELAHLILHLEDKNVGFLDNTEQAPDVCSLTPLEEEANALTRDLLIPLNVWKEIGEPLLYQQEEARVLQVAERLSIHPAIVAGRVRRESGDYTSLARLVGNKEVRVHFQEWR